MAYSGGGYFRFFPLSFVKKEMKKSKYAMCYFHIGDLIPESKKMQSRADYEAYYKEPGTFNARMTRYVKSNMGKKNAFDKMMQLIDDMDFIGLHQADGSIDWDLATVVKL